MKKRIAKLIGLIAVLVVIFANSMTVLAAVETQDYVGRHSDELVLDEDTVIRYQTVNDIELEGTVIEQSITADGKTVLVVGDMRPGIAGKSMSVIGIAIIAVTVLTIFIIVKVVTKGGNNEKELLESKRV